MQANISPHRIKSEYASYSDTACIFRGSGRAASPVYAIHDLLYVLLPTVLIFEK